MRPLVVGTPPTGMQPPPWFGEDDTGTVLTGAALGRVGVQPPILHPEQAVLLHVVAEG